MKWFNLLWHENWSYCVKYVWCLCKLQNKSFIMACCLWWNGTGKGRGWKTATIIYCCQQQQHVHSGTPGGGGREKEEVAPSWCPNGEDKHRTLSFAMLTRMEAVGQKRNTFSKLFILKVCMSGVCVCVCVCVCVLSVVCHCVHVCAYQWIFKMRWYSHWFRVAYNKSIVGQLGLK